jgi:hypothetical protein
MNRRWLLMAGICGAAVAGIAIPRHPTFAQRAADVNQLGWLIGCWASRAGTRLIEEQWMAPRGGTMLGMSRTVRNDTLIEFEHLRVFQRGARVVYAAMPSGQAMAEFEAVATTDSVVVFENPAHDFPQRIIYRRRGADSLLARIEGSRAGVTRGVDFSYGKRGCGQEEARMEKREHRPNREALARVEHGGRSRRSNH